MKLQNKTANEITLSVSYEELRSISNALNEVCNGAHIADVEFATRLGVGRAKLAAMLESISEYAEPPNDG